jgi:glycosyltransferase involved in cell wall biosynthesis
MKILQILTHSPSWITKNIEEDIYDGWQVRTAKAIQKITNEYELECWLPEKTCKKTIAENRDGINYKIFPSNPISYGREISQPLIQEIKKIQEKQIIIHIHGLHNYLTYKISRIFRNLPIIVQHHGDCPPLNLIERRKVLLPLIPLLAFEQVMMNNSLKFVDQFFVLTEQEKQVLSKIVIPEKVKIQGMGVDFNLFMPNDKHKAKRQLNLTISEEKKILLYVGKLQKYKGCKLVIDAFDKLKAKYDVQLLLVGAGKNDPLFSYAKAKGAIIIQRQPNELMPIYYQAADLTLLPIAKALKWRGVGVSIVESLACNTPVVAGNLKNFPWDIAKIGFVATNLNQVIEGTELILKNPVKFSNCRLEAQKYFDWSIIAQNTIAIYHKLIKEYYGNNNLKS